MDEDTFLTVRRRFRDWADNAASFIDFTIGVQMAAQEIEHGMSFNAQLALFDVTVHPPLERR